VARDDAPDGADDGLRPLSGADVDVMLDLVERTRPGPFARRTIELGEYLGVFVDRQLAAMAGERMRIVGLVEISAVCTDPAFRRRGYAATLVRALMRRIRRRGDRPFLHVASGNEDAIRLYVSLGFEQTRTLELCGVRAPG
jgi:predicted GNAT family acetyltransferase